MSYMRVKNIIYTLQDITLRIEMTARIQCSENVMY